MTKLSLFLGSVALIGLNTLTATAAPPDYLPLEQYDASRLASASVKPPASAMYVALKGASLRATLENWAQISGWQEVIWKLPPDTDFTLGATGRYEGDFVSVTKALVASFGEEAKLRVHFHGANKVVSVDEDLE
ncbi:MAG: TcpQ domain-containing protein [Agitococcus sp.]|nr:TcpQ domain-containing protein [Agitococcus sp.]MDO9179231.1 TcpQ domain-containing protein [Agitococcus sp.]